MKRAILIVLDSAGIGELPDAGEYGDVGSNTLINTKKAVPEMRLDNLNALGLSNILGCGALSDKRIDNPRGAFGRAAEASKGKDTTVGHWEIAGLIVEKALPTYPEGFPEDLLMELEKRTGRGVIGNCAASGTEIIERLGDTHVQTGKLIVYTSADSVFQIAAHEDVVPLDELYSVCEAARELLCGEHSVSRVIARPFRGESFAYKRTPNRRDFSLAPIGKTMLDVIKENGQEVSAVGKIEDIFAGAGVTRAVHTSCNSDGVDKTLLYMDSVENGLIFTNLVDFDMLFGHRNDPLGYAKALEEFDARLPEIIARLKDTDLLIITADHGCDPTTESTDHSREYVPILVYGRHIKAGVDLGTRESFADIAASVLTHLGIDGDIKGESFLDLIFD